MSEPLIVVGASYAGLQTALSAREAGFAEPILLLGDEDDLPYQRPPLSKGFLLGKVTESALPIRAQQVLDQHRIEFLPRTRITAIDRTARTVETADGKRIHYGWLALATGCGARRLPAEGADLDGVMVLRTLADARALMARLPGIDSAVIIGGGFIGLEVAASLTTLGKQVAVVEMQDRLLARALPPRMSEFLAHAHRRAGVDLVMRMGVARLIGNGRRIAAVELTDGRKLDADLVVVGIGASVNDQMAAACGLACGDDIVVDEYARTSDPHIVAAGDCTRHPNRFAGRPIRLESVQNALDQAKTAGATLAGQLKPYDAVPWFWSDQYDLKLQMVGFSEGHDQAVLRGSPDDNRFSVFYFRDGTLIGVDSVNAGGDHMAGRQIIPANTPITPDEAADPSFNLAALVKAARSRAAAGGR